MLLTAVGGAVLALLVVAAAVVPAAPVLAALAAVALAGAALALAGGAVRLGAVCRRAGRRLDCGRRGLTTTELTVTEPALAAGPLAVVAEGPPDGPAMLEPAGAEDPDWPAAGLPWPGVVVCCPMASCSTGRAAPAPAGAPRWNE